MLRRLRFRLTGAIALSIVLPAEVVVSPILDAPSPSAMRASENVPAPPRSRDKTANRQTTTVAKADVAGSERPAPATRLLDPEPDHSSIDYGAIERLRRSDPRYSRLELDVRDGRIVIACTEGNPELAWELAAKIAPHTGGREILLRPGNGR